MHIYIFFKKLHTCIYILKNGKILFVDQLSPYTHQLVHKFDLRSPISCKKIFYKRAILIFRRFYKTMETRSVLIVCTYVRTCCTCVNCIYSVHIYNFRESAYIAYIYKFLLHMGHVAPSGSATPFSRLDAVSTSVPSCSQPRLSVTS